MESFQIINWEKRQSIRSKRPSWLKLHASLLDNMPFQSMSADARAFLPMMWLVAAESKDAKSGVIDLGYREIHWRLRSFSQELVISCMKECIDKGFIAFIPDPVTDLQEPVTDLHSSVQPCNRPAQNCSTEKRREERETERKTERKKKIIKKENYQNEDSEALWKQYPEVETKGNKQKFEKSLWQQLKNGESYEEINNGVTRYADYCNATGIYTGHKTRWNKHAVTWINNKEWKTKYPAPAKEAPAENGIASEYAHARARQDRKQAAEAAGDYDDTALQHYSGEGEGYLLEGVIASEESNKGI